MRRRPDEVLGEELVGRLCNDEVGQEVRVEALHAAVLVEVVDVAEARDGEGDARDADTEPLLQHGRPHDGVDELQLLLAVPADAVVAVQREQRLRQPVGRVLDERGPHGGDVARRETRDEGLDRGGAARRGVHVRVLPRPSDVSP